MGYHLEYSSISPSILGHLEVRNLRIIDNDGNEKITIKKLKIYYSFFNFFKDDPLAAIERIGIENVSILWDFDHDTVPSFLSSGSSSGTKTGTLPRIEVSGNNISFQFIRKGQQITAEKIYFKYTPEEIFRSWDLDLKGQCNFIPAEDLAEQVGPIFLQFELNGIISDTFNQAEAEMTLVQIKSSYIDAQKLKFLVNWKNSKIELRKIHDRIPYDLIAGYDLNTDQLKVTFKSENFIPSNYIKINDKLEILAPLFDCGITGKAEAEIFPWAQEITYTGDLKLQVPITPWISIPFEADFSVQGDQDHLKFDSLDINISPGRYLFYR